MTWREYMIKCEPELTITDELADYVLWNLTAFPAASESYVKSQVRHALRLIASGCKDVEAAMEEYVPQEVSC